jgi:hypothetical protein
VNVLFAANRTLTGITSRTSVLTGPLLAAVFTVLLLGRLFLLPIVPLDEGILLTHSELILKGALPHRDFCSLYPPGNYWLLAAAFRLFGASIIVERAVGLLYVLAIVWAVFFLLKSEGFGVALLAAASVGVVLRLFPATLGAYAWFGGAALTLWSLYFNTRAAQAERYTSAANSFFLGGLLGGFAILFRHDMAPAILFSALAAVGIARRPIMRYLGGLFLGTAPLALHMIVVSPEVMLNNMVRDVLVAGPGRKLPLPLSSWLFWITVISAVAPALLVVAGRFLRSQPVPPIARGAAALALCLLPQAMSRADSWHLTYVASIAIPLLIVTALNVPSTDRRWHVPVVSGTSSQRLRRPRLNAVAFVGLAALAGKLTFNQLRAPLWPELARFVACERCVRSEGRFVPMPSEKARQELQSVVDELKRLSVPGDKVLVGPYDLARTNYSDAYVYFLLPWLQVSSYYIEMANGVSNRPGTRLAGDLSRSRFAVLSTQYDTWSEANASGAPGSAEPLAVLEREFCLHSTHGFFRLYVHCATERCGASESHRCRD